MLKIGDVEIRRIEEVLLHEQTILFADWNEGVLDEHRDLLVPSFYDLDAKAFNVSIHSWLLKTPSHTVLIDTCGGNHKERPASPRFHQLDTPYLGRLKEAGVTPEDVDTVICTHLHVDHVGWNTRLVDGRWVPTFPNATYVFPRVEVEWRDPAQGAKDKPEAVNLVFLDSVQPILDAGMAKLVESDERFSDEIDFMPTPGHAPGQMAVRLRVGGQEVIFIADVTHLPIQAYYPSWCARYDEDPAVSAKTRRRMFEYCADNSSLILPGHYNTPHGAYLRRHGDAFELELLEAAP